MAWSPHLVTNEFHNNPQDHWTAAVCSRANLLLKGLIWTLFMTDKHSTIPNWVRPQLNRSIRNWSVLLEFCIFFKKLLYFTGDCRKMKKKTKYCCGLSWAGWLFAFCKCPELSERIRQRHLLALDSVIQLAVGGLRLLNLVIGWILEIKGTGAWKGIKEFEERSSAKISKTDWKK